MRRPSISTLAAAALAILLTGSFVACTLDSERELKFELLVLTAEGGTQLQLQFLDPDTGAALASLPLSNLPSTILTSPDHSAAYFGGQQGIFRIDARTRTMTLVAGSPAGGLLAISRDGQRLLLLVGNPLRAVVYNLQQSTSTAALLEGSADVRGAFAGDGTALVADGGGLLVIYPDGQSQRFTTNAWAVAAHPTAGVAAILTNGGHLALLSICDGTVLASDSAATLQPPLAFLPDGKTILSTADQVGLGVSTVTVPNGFCPTSASFSASTSFPSEAGIGPVKFTITDDGPAALVTATPDLRSFGAGLYSAASGTYREFSLGQNTGSTDAAFIGNVGFVTAYEGLYRVEEGTASLLVAGKPMSFVKVLRR